MFCDRCGATLQQGQRFCSSCGNAVSGITSAAPGAIPSRIQGHLRILAILWFIVSGFIFLPGVFLLGFSPQIVSFIPPDVPAIDLVRAILPAVGIFMTAIAAVGFFAGWGLLERAPWARVLSIVLACFSLFHVPLGTALGIYTLWVLLPESSEQEYRQGFAPNAGPLSA
jgi:hypothetical protein